MQEIRKPEMYTTKSHNEKAIPNNPLSYSVPGPYGGSMYDVVLNTEIKLLKSCIISQS